MKTFKFLPLAIVSSVAFAETAVPVVEAASPLSPNTVNIATKTIESVLPQLSFEAQQARIAADENLRAEQERLLAEQQRLQAQKFAEMQNKIRQALGDRSLLLMNATTKIYLDNDFNLIWQDKVAEKAFLKDYALFAVSGVSSKSAQALQQLMDTPDGIARDILLTDSFLDYLYYNKNVAANANQWLYNLGSYVPKSPSMENIAHWQAAIKSGNMTQFITHLFPKNHIYQQTIEKLLQGSANSDVQSQPKAGKNKKAKAQSQGIPFEKLALNAQRLRLIPSFNNGIFVNIPSYQLYYFRDGQLALQSRVIVGREDRRTPVLYSKLSNVVVNPPWNVPPSILNKDLVPKLKRDPSYADRAGFEIFDSRGNKLSSSSINWSAYGENVPFRIRQKAGDDSALGHFKFNMPSSDAIYLHDTPKRELFNKSSRALSSGCVRVAKSDELASILLKEVGWSAERKQNVLASQKTTSAQIRSDNPVYLYYVTAWIEGGQVHTLPDIYKYDVNLPKSRLDWQAVKNLL